MHGWVLVPLGMGAIILYGLAHKKLADAGFYKIGIEKDICPSVIKLDENELNNGIKESIERLKNERGFIVLESDEKEDFTVLINGGEKKETEYEINLKELKTVNGVTNIIIEEVNTKENKGSISYPILVIKTKDIVNNFIVKNTLGEEFKRMKRE